MISMTPRPGPVRGSLCSHWLDATGDRLVSASRDFDTADICERSLGSAHSCRVPRCYEVASTGAQSSARASQTALDHCVCCGVVTNG